MKKMFLPFMLLCLANTISAQNVYTIKADSVKLTGCDSSELIIENHTQNVPGFLFNTGNGRTSFKTVLQKINDTTYLVGLDTLKVKTPAITTGNGLSSTAPPKIQLGQPLGAAGDPAMISTITEIPIHTGGTLEFTWRGLTGTPPALVINPGLIRLAGGTLQTQAITSQLFSTNIFTDSTKNRIEFKTAHTVTDLQQFTGTDNFVFTRSDNINPVDSGVQFQVRLKTQFYDSLRAKTVSNGDSSGSVATTAWVKRQGYSLGGSAFTGSLNSSLAINGTISAQRLKLSQTGWPDYVFDSCYQLLPIGQLEKYIKANNHLPGIPSAAEVEKKGVDVGDNQAVLLKKIEELTLYNIAQEKKLDEQAKKLELLEKKMNTFMQRKTGK